MGEVELGIGGEEETLTALKEPRGWGRVQTIIGPSSVRMGETLAAVGAHGMGTGASKLTRGKLMGEAGTVGAVERIFSGSCFLCFQS